MAPSRLAPLPPPLPPPPPPLLVLPLLLLLLAADAAPAPQPQPQPQQPIQSPLQPRQTRLKVFVLAGQSNAVGMAEVATLNASSPGGRVPLNGTLAYQLRDPRTARTFAPLWDAATQNWTVLEDVAMWYNEVGGKSTMDNGSAIPGTNGVDACFGPLTVGYGAGCGANRRNNFGPELGFGFGMAAGLPEGEKFLVMKNAWGGKTLCGDFRPPRSAAAADPYCTHAATCAEAGHYYNVTTSNVAKMMAPGAIGRMFPALAGLTPEIAGFGWWQGWNDGCDLNCTAAYEQNLVNLVQDLRDAWGNPALPVSVATAGFLSPAMSAAEEQSRQPHGCWRAAGGNKLGCNCANDRGCRRIDVVLSQLDATNAARHPELRGHAVTVDQRPYYREAQFSPNPRQGYHYWHNGETYYMTGLAMATGMLEAMPTERPGSRRRETIAYLDPATPRVVGNKEEE